MKTINIIFSIVFIFILSCEKEEIPPELENVTLNKDAVTFLKVTPGKYLIYKDSTTSETDSIIITKCEFNKLYQSEIISNNIFIPSTPAHYYEHFELIYTKKTDANESSIWFKGIANANYSFFAPLSNIPLNLVDYIDTFELYSGSFYYDENTILIPNMTIEGIIYENILVHKTFNGLEIDNPYYLKTEYYWAKGIGIIQQSIERSNGVRQTFYLIRHN